MVHAVCQALEIPSHIWLGHWPPEGLQSGEERDMLLANPMTVRSAASCGGTWVKLLVQKGYSGKVSWEGALRMSFGNRCKIGTGRISSREEGGLKEGYNTQSESVLGAMRQAPYQVLNQHDFFESSWPPSFTHASDFWGAAVFQGMNTDSVLQELSPVGHAIQ